MMYLVTGAAGFIGSHLVERLIRDGKQVRAVDNLSTRRFENIRPFLSEIEFVLGDLSDYPLAESVVDGVEYMLHQAAIPSVPRSVKNPIRTNQSIVTATLNLFEASRKAGVKRIVQASSSSVYGNTLTLPKVETMPVQPISPYAIAKYAQEAYGKVYSEIYGLSVVSLRYFNVFGPRQDPFSEYSAVIPKFISKVLKDESPVIYGDGETTRDFTYIDNVVHANLLACHAGDDVSGKAMNVGCGSRIRLKELVEMINTHAGKNMIPQFAPERTGDVKHSLADIQLARDLMGYDVVVSVEEGVKRTVDFMVKGGS